VIELAFVTWNRLEYTRLALSSLLADPDEEFRLSIWDNGSTDGTRDYLRSEVDDRRIHDITFSEENVGQIVAVNTIWSRSGAELLGKIDNDCLLTPGWTRTLAAAHRDIDRLGVVACWHYFADDFDYERAKWKIQEHNGHRIFRHPWTCGTGLLIKRSTYREVGPMRGTSTTEYWLEMAARGYINGFYYPLVFQEHMDDPKSRYTRLKDEESYQSAKSDTYNLNYHGQATLSDRWIWRQRVLDNLLDDPWEASHYLGWRARARRLRSRVSQSFGR
jgi:glycosyltransferase involved in cell wall biosynthesis